ncbi:hypothetical protein GCM10010532_114070 [Dactylosporangium siamense]
MCADHPVNRPGGVVGQVEPVGDLDRGRGAEPGALGIAAGPVPADDLSARLGPQPGGEAGGPPVGQEIHQTAGVSMSTTIEP